MKACTSPKTHKDHNDTCHEGHKHSCHNEHEHGSCHEGYKLSCHNEHEHGSCHEGHKHSCHNEHEHGSCHEGHKHACSCEEAQHFSISSHEEHSHDEGEQSLLLVFSTLVLLASAFILDKWVQPSWFSESIRFVWYLVTLLLVSYPVLCEGGELIFKRGDFFNEIVLMLVAVIGAFIIGEYAEAVMLMLLYTLGEYFEHKASEKARGSISALIDSRPKTVLRLTGNESEVISPELCKVGDLLQMVPGERVALDGVLISEHGTFDTSALTGESLPVELGKEASIAAGAIVQSHPVTIRVSKPYGESTLARILEQVEQSSANKPQAERFIRRFARFYTPAVFALSLLTVLVPFFIGLATPHFDFVFRDWFYIALVVLVTSCPCALIISIPLSYFSGIGAASKHGLIFKGARFLEILPKVKQFIFDKTGTLTEGKFSVSQEMWHVDAETQATLRGYVLDMESQSSHPIASAVCQYLSALGVTQLTTLSEREEIAGMGMRAKTEKGEEILVGNTKLLQKFSIPTETLPSLLGSETAIHVAFKGTYCCSYILQDRIKPNSASSIRELQQRGIEVAMLSGDSPSSVEAIGEALGVDKALGGLMPQDKIAQTKILAEGQKVAFVGDGINDAPVMALCDLSFAMGGIGSEAAIEAADVIIQSDDPAMILKGINVAKKTHQVAWQNIVLALGIKVAVMLLAYLGIGSLILAIFADVGVTLLAVLNAVRLLHYRA